MWRVPKGKRGPDRNLGSGVRKRDGLEKRTERGLRGPVGDREILRSG